jgi:hypothetical protein
MNFLKSLLRRPSAPSTSATAVGGKSSLPDEENAALLLLEWAEKGDAAHVS